MDIDQLLDELDGSREKLLMAIADLPDDALMTPGAWEEWSIADILVNLTVWEAELVTGIMRLDQGKRPEAFLSALAQPEAYDQARYEENKGRDLDRVFDDWQQVRVQLEEWIETMPFRHLTTPSRYKWLGGKSLWQTIQQTLIAREKRFLPHVQLFAHRWQLENEEDA
ncbi:MAG: ClbS/DfsB family four-helix bundle protein [Chloroflexota bacterium]|nr:ClbS/DfsB family four-helix bundle protein [Anaerolineales bacterium]MCB8965569.1 ClbS/DfsB family four-helix bundle protein [Ardenticatenaceae bacterium]